MTELRKQINNIVEDHQACLTLAKSMNGNEVYEGTTATAEDIVIGKTAYSNGELIVGISTKSIDLTPQIRSLYRTFYQNKELTGEISFSFPNATKEAEETFYQCTNITNINFVASKITDLTKTFAGCLNLQTAIIDCPNVETTINIFGSCSKLEEVTLLNTSKYTSLTTAFYNCSNLKTLSVIDASSLNSMLIAFVGCTALENVGGFLNYGKAFTSKTVNTSNYTLDLSACTNLTHESLMNIINNLYDLNLTYNVANGGTLYRQMLNLGETNLAKITADEIMIATNKGWTVA